MKLLLTSFMRSATHDQVLAKMIGKEINETKVAYIENAYNAYRDGASLIEGREILKPTNDIGYNQGAEAISNSVK